MASPASLSPQTTGFPGMASVPRVVHSLSRPSLRSLSTLRQATTPSQKHGLASIAASAASRRQSALWIPGNPLLESRDARHVSVPAVSTVPGQELSLGELLREDFPILQQEISGGIPLVYLDSGATSQKPRQVLAAMDDYYNRCNANVHRGVHTLSALATEAYEGGRDKVQGLIGAAMREEVVFTRNASEAINLVAYSWGAANLKPGDEVVLTVAEHHSNLVPWQLASERTGCVLRFAGLKRTESSGGVVGEEINVEEMLDLINPKTRLVALQHVSNVLGSELPVKEIIERAHAVGARVLLDACQSVPHMPVNVQDLGVDFLVASAHKMLGPTGMGFLYAPYDLLKDMPPFLGGGEMIADVFLDHSTYAEPPARFEAGTPAIAEAVGLGAAVDYMQGRVPGGMESIHSYEVELSEYLYSEMVEIPGIRVYGPPPLALSSSGGSATHRAAALCAFNVEGVHPTDLSTFLDQQHGIAIRSGHHCAQPLHRELGVSSSARVSLHIYNTRDEIDRFIAALKDTQDFFLNMGA